MIKRISIHEVPPKRGASATTRKVILEFQNLQKELSKKKLGPYEAELVMLEGLPSTKPSTLKNASLRLLKLAKSYIEQENLPYTAFLRQNGKAMYVVGKNPHQEAA